MDCTLLTYLSKGTMKSMLFCNGGDRDFVKEHGIINQNVLRT